VPPPAEPPGFDDFNFGGAGGFNAATPPVTLAAQVACEIAATVRCAVSWSSLSGFVYRVDRAWGGGALDFITVSNNITAAPGIATYVEAATNSCPVLYRIGALRQTP